MQYVISLNGGQARRLELPDANSSVWSGLLWGKFDEPLTPAFWASQAWMWQPGTTQSYRLGGTFSEEIVYCLLGGHGAPAEVGLAAARRVCNRLKDLDAKNPTRTEFEKWLREPLPIGDRTVRYRFAAQRARYLEGIFEKLDDVDYVSLADGELRNVLLDLPGIGPKTASWIVRNWRSSNDVAILDVHIVRACSAIGIFQETQNLARNYSELEGQFLAFCQATRSKASAMDAVMWSTMRGLSKKLLHHLVDQAKVAIQPKPVHRSRVEPCRETMSVGGTKATAARQ